MSELPLELVGSSSAPGSGSPRRSPTSKRSSTEPAAGKQPAKPPAKRRAAKPLTTRELTNRLLRLAGQRHQPRSAVKIHLGPRGQVMVDVLVQAGDTDEQVKKASTMAQTEFELLFAKYNGGELPTGEVVGRGQAGE